LTVISLSNCSRPLTTAPRIYCEGGYKIIKTCVQRRCVSSHQGVDIINTRNSHNNQTPVLSHSMQMLVYTTKEIVTVHRMHSYTLVNAIPHGTSRPLLPATHDISQRPLSFAALLERRTGIWVPIEASVSTIKLIVLIGIPVV